MNCTCLSTWKCFMVWNLARATGKRLLSRCPQCFWCGKALMQYQGFGGNKEEQSIWFPSARLVACADQYCDQVCWCWHANFSARNGKRMKRLAAVGFYGIAFRPHKKVWQIHTLANKVKVASCIESISVKSESSVPWLQMSVLVLFYLI